MPLYIINYGLQLQGKMEIEAESKEEAKEIGNEIIEENLQSFGEYNDLYAVRPTVPTITDDWMEAIIKEEDNEEEGNE